MSEIKNKIISISGEPVSGKSTVVKSLKAKYEQMGYTVHIEPIGNYWREAAVETYKKVKPEIENPTLDQIHADPDFEGMRKEIDLALDAKVKARGEEINTKNRPNEIFIFDSRLAWQNIPSSYAVRLTVDERIAGLRLYYDKKRGTEDQHSSKEEAIEATRIRKEEEIKRYKRRYGVDLTDRENYDLIVDTSYSNTQELADIIIDGEKAYREGNKYSKMWASPVSFLSEQRIESTYDDKIETIVEDIKQNGYDPIDGILHIIERDGIKILLDGNHRISAGLSVGKTLFPYEIVERGNIFFEQTMHLICDDNTLKLLYDWSDIIGYRAEKVGKIELPNEEVESFKGFCPERLIAVSKIPKLRKIFKLDEKMLEEQQIGEGR